MAGRDIVGIQFDTKLKQNQFVDKKVGQSDLDKIMSLLQSRLDEDGYFLYLKPSDNADPYDLIPMVVHRPVQKESTDSYGSPNGKKYLLIDLHMMDDIKQTKLGDYYTLSKKGITHYVNGFPTDFT